MRNIFRGVKNWIGRVWYESRIWLIFSLLGLIFILVFLSPRIIYTIGPGQAGVLWLRFFGGTVVDRVVPEGNRFIFPWDKLYIYDVKVQEVRHEIDVLSQNGLTFHLFLSVRFRPEYDFLGMLHQRVGPDYVRKVVIPQVESVMRTTIGNFLPEEVYTTQGAVIQKYLLEATAQVSAKYIIIDEIIIRQIGLPTEIKKAIEEKLIEQQRAQAYQYIIEKERQEKLRKKIEAEGISAYQKIVSRTLTDRLLAWRGVEATLKLAESQNTKVVVIGRGKDGLPIILDLKDGGVPGIQQNNQKITGKDEEPSALPVTGQNGKTMPRARPLDKTEPALSLPKEQAVSSPNTKDSEPVNKLAAPQTYEKKQD